MSQSQAERSAAAMWANDRASQGLGMQIAEVTPGRAVLTMSVREDMVNGLDVCHGGFIFTLADSAFAFACNSYNQLTFAQHCAVTFHAPGRLGDTLTATAQEVTRQGRSGLYDVTVTDGSGALIATFRGHSRTVKGQHYQEDTE
ncbi:hydroxyphenylacetyl-CoA thioesterase PaaI [Pseudooceanicola onchidii]|uniref:hydroxyphenylacetyl-CoA thioesterase PaaI n=1 Tax=Pseudooceanicola onchidii TaxID=2562279 RepID=UPI0010AAC023|nr:hydroxyphenylacetyl-CoA thioesterase PaaI [Pseudooceanicola onchidii]